MHLNTQHGILSQLQEPSIHLSWHPYFNKPKEAITSRQ